ncbi:hypothetical protein A33M_3998 [Rhodovulum sp. PH10]|nr:hypothetical protein A33M_3998 [Rhodovulum sp. PH10]
MFVVIWYELAIELGLGADTAFLATLGLMAIWWSGLRLVAQGITLMGPFTFGLLAQTAVWLVLFWWFAPAAFHALPLLFDLLIVLALALSGARCRFLYEAYRQSGRRFVPAEHSGLVLLVVFGGLAACMVSLRYWGSLWPLAGYALLPAIPFGFGWRMAPLAAPDRFDAKVGDADAFRDAGLSEER